ncbi:Permease of the major facilitator superfamily [Candidatus Paraburkholderia calva]|nr:Permease of the major facilitator superfamily [Candidatus Paraburkholderia calva]
MSGAATPVIITCGRLLQGFSAGGEVGGSVAMLVENAPGSHKGFASSFQQMSQGGRARLAGLVGLVLTNLFTDAQISGGAWRIAFGLLIGPVGWYIRRSIPETRAFETAKREDAPPLLPTLAAHRWHLLGGVAIMVFWTVATYVSNYYDLCGARAAHDDVPVQNYLGQMAYGITMVLMCPVIGKLSDRIGVRKPMLFGALLTAVIAYPLFWLLAHHPGPLPLMALQACIGLRVKRAGGHFPDALPCNRRRLRVHNGYHGYHGVRRPHTARGDQPDRSDGRQARDRLLPRGGGSGQQHRGSDHHAQA